MSRPPAAETEAALAELEALHAEVDEDARAMAERHAGRLQCGRGCASCCVDELTVFEVEAERIRRHHPELLRDGTPHPAGACAFLDAAGACRIYADRPYVCRTQGLPLRWYDEMRDGRVHERRDICPLNLEGPGLESLDDDACWLIGPVEQGLAVLQEHFGGERRRVALRSLFRRSDLP